MDIYCPICGEPWAIDTLHDADGLSYKQARASFRIRGCETFETKHSESRDNETSALSAMLFDLLGNDVDGIAAEMADIF